jgi:Family of unknown function (DUF6159)
MAEQPPTSGYDPSAQWNQPPQYQPPQWSPPAPMRGTGRATGRQLLSASWAMLRQDRELLWLPAIAAITGFFAAVILFAPGFAIGWFAGGDQHHAWGGWVGGAFAAFGASVVSIYFQAALVIGANQRADGGDPNVRGVLAEAWTHRARIVSWAALTTTVGVAIRAVEQRLGILGSILGFLGGVAWAIASFLVVPVVVVEGLSPIAAVKRSAQLVRDTWGTSVRTTVRFGITYVLFLLLPIAVIVVGVFALASGSGPATAIGIVLIVAGVAGFVALAMVFSAISTYARALIYRYATGRTVPGIDPQLFAGAFAPKRGRGRTGRGRFA